VLHQLSLPQNLICVLEYLNINFDPTTDEIAAAFINVLDNNRGLTQLDLTFDSDDIHGSATGWFAASNVMCNNNSALEVLDMMCNINNLRIVYQ